MGRQTVPSLLSPYFAKATRSIIITKLRGGGVKATIQFFGGWGVGSVSVLAHTEKKRAKMALLESNFENGKLSYGRPNGSPRRGILALSFSQCIQKAPSRKLKRVEHPILIVLRPYVSRISFSPQ